MFLRLNWEIIGLISCVVLFVSVIVERFINLFKLDELDESFKLIKEEYSWYFMNMYEEEDVFIGKMDWEVIFMFGKLLVDVENFMLRELK